MDLKSIEKYKNILVTGGAGAIGSNLVRKLTDLNVPNIIILDNLDSGIENNILKSKNVTFINGDIRDQEVLDKIFEKKIDIIFHLAANFANQNSIDNPEKDLLVNILGTLKLLEMSRKNKVYKFVYFNTSCMYNKDSDILSEDNINFNFETPYAISKHSAEYYGLFYHEFHNVPFVSMRIFNSYGPYEYAGEYRNVIPIFFNRAINNKPLTIMGDGSDTRNFTYVGDIVDGSIAIALDPMSSGQVFNIGSDISIKIIDLANKINKITDNDAGIEFINKRKWDKTKQRKASIDKIKKQIGYRTSVNIDEGLLEYYKWFKEQNYENFNY